MSTPPFSSETRSTKPGPDIDPAHNILKHAGLHPLSVFFRPRAVVVVGASETPGSVGRTLLWNLLSTPFGGTIYPVNPKRSSVLGIKTYPTVGDVPETPDLAVIATPANTVPEVVHQCAAAGARAAIIISAGFKETGEAGLRLEQEVLAEARRGGMRIIGPNCLGLMSPLTGLNATFASSMALPGNVAFVSQSGALCAAILDWSLTEMVGFSAFISIGSMADVSWGDLIDYLGDDERTRSIILYMETIGDARSFLSAARQVALNKPIILIKGGRTEAAAKAASSHTGAMTGSDAVLDAALRRCGVLRVNSIASLFYMAEVLAKQPRPNGPRLTILTNSGGPGVLATDMLIGAGGELAQLAPETMDALNGILPRHWSHANPIDILGDADPERFGKAFEIVSRDPNTDGLLVILTPVAMADPTQTAHRLSSFSKLEGKPVLASWMGGAQVAEGERVLNHSNIPTFPYPDTAVRAFNYMWRYSYNLRALYETPSIVSEGANRDRSAARGVIERARAEERVILNEFESKEVLKSYDIPVVETRTAIDEQEAVLHADAIGYPVVLKLLSQTVTHKTEVQGVQLNLGDEAAVRAAYRRIQEAVVEAAGAEAFQGVTVQPMIQSTTRSAGYELILGSTTDPQFGPVLLFGTGGQLVEIFQDRALALPPLNTTLARRMMEQTRVYRALQGVRGRKAVDLAALEETLVRFSDLVLTEYPSIREIDINPLLVSEQGLLALDARVMLHAGNIPADQLPRPAIRPYPAQYTWEWDATDGTHLTIRPIRPEDEPLMVGFHQSLSEDSVYRRYFHMVSLGHRVAHDRLVRMCFIDYDREMALVAERVGAETADRQIAGVGRWSRISGTNDAEVALLVADPFQHQGIGLELMMRLVEIARAEKLTRIIAEILTGNQEMQNLCVRVGFTLHQTNEGSVRAVLELF